MVGVFHYYLRLFILLGLNRTVLKKACNNFIIYLMHVLDVYRNNSLILLLMFFRCYVFILVSFDGVLVIYHEPFC